MSSVAAFQVGVVERSPGGLVKHVGACASYFPNVCIGLARIPYGEAPSSFLAEAGGTVPFAFLVFADPIGPKIILGLLKVFSPIVAKI